MSESKFELMRHALGVHSYGSGSKWKKPYRNHFVAGGDHVAIWDGLVAEGYARKTSNGNVLTGGDPAYVVTDVGREQALAGITFKKTWGYGVPENP